MWFDTTNQFILLKNMSKIKVETFKGLIWTSIGNIGAGLLNLLVTMFLARLLNPSDFGILELVLVVTSISVVFVDSGFSQALIRDKEATVTDLSTVFWVNLTISICLYVLLFFVCPLLAKFWNVDEFGSIGRVAFLVIIIDALGLIQNVTFTKNMNFKPIAISMLVSTLFSGCIGALLAYLGYGVWSLVIFLLLTSTFKTALLWIQGKKFLLLSFSKDSVKKYYKFGSYLFVQSLIDKIMINVESLLIGRFYSKSQLGYYSQSRKIDSYLGQALTNIVVKVSFPALVKINDTDERLKYGYRKIIGLTTFVIFPFMLFLIVFPKLTMAVLFGSQWSNAGIYLQWWAIFGIVHPIQSICNNIFYVKGKSRELLIITAVKQMLKLLAIIALVKYSVLSMQIGIIITSVIMMFVYAFFSGRHISYSLLELGQDIYRNLIAGIVSITLAYIITSLFCSSNVVLSFVICAGIHTCFYVLTSYCMKNNNLHELLELLVKTFK